MSFQKAVYVEEEDVGFVEVCAILSGETVRQVTVNFSTVEDSNATGLQLYMIGTTTEPTLILH